MDNHLWLFYVDDGDSNSGGHGSVASTLTSVVHFQPLHLTFETGSGAVDSCIWVPSVGNYLCGNLRSHYDPCFQRPLYFRRNSAGCRDLDFPSDPYSSFETQALISV